MDMDRYFERSVSDSASITTDIPALLTGDNTLGGGGGTGIGTEGASSLGSRGMKFDHSFQLSMFVLLLSAGLVLWIIRHIIRSRGQNSCGYKAKKRPALKPVRGGCGPRHVNKMCYSSYSASASAFCGGGSGGSETFQDRIIQLKVLRILEETSNVNTSLSKIPTTQNIRMT